MTSWLKRNLAIASIVWFASADLALADIVRRPFVVGGCEGGGGPKAGSRAFSSPSNRGSPI
jgi:hypothetical protein